MPTKIGINGFGRMGRLALRAAWDWPELDIVHINEVAGDAVSAAHLLQFDSVHGRWEKAVNGDDEGLAIDGSQAIVTAASCTTNCLAPVVDVIHGRFGIRHGCITTIHDITNTQSILDEYHKDLRRARASGLSLIPTSTGSATAITEIFPELKGKLNGIAVRVPLANASLTDCVFEVERPVTVEDVNSALERAAQGYLEGVLDFERRPLVSVDYTNDTRSSIIDAGSTMVIDDTQVKILAWYDNEIGYVNRMMELASLVARSL